MKKITFVAVLLALVAVTAMAQARPQPAGSPAMPSLDERIKAEIGDFKGKVWIYAKNLDTGKEYGMRADEQVRTASTIKLPIMTEVFRQVAEGKIAWTDPIEITKAVKVGGSGILFEFTDGTKIDVKTAMTLMIVQSDNTATNVILDKVSSNSVNDFMAKLGLNDTLSPARSAAEVTQRHGMSRSISSSASGVHRRGIWSNCSRCWRKARSSRRKHRRK